MLKKAKSQNLVVGHKNTNKPIQLSITDFQVIDDPGYKLSWADHLGVTTLNKASTPLIGLQYYIKYTSVQKQEILYI